MSFKPTKASHITSVCFFYCSSICGPLTNCEWMFRKLFAFFSIWDLFPLTNHESDSKKNLIALEYWISVHAGKCLWNVKLKISGMVVSFTIVIHLTSEHAKRKSTPPKRLKEKTGEQSSSIRYQTGINKMSSRLSHHEKQFSIYTNECRLLPKLCQWNENLP